MSNSWRTMLLFTGAVMLVVGVVVGVGCADDEKKGGMFSDTPAPPPPPRRGPAAAASNASADASADAGADAEAKAVFGEEDFVETELSRDPFRAFAKMFADESNAAVRTQREVLLDRYSVDELKLVGIVTGTAQPRAMLVDPTGTGWIVHRGQFIGKAELVRGTGTSGASYELNWRVDRIRDGDIVLVREDPAHSDIPPATRVIPLRPEDTASASR